MPCILRTAPEGRTAGRCRKGSRSCSRPATSQRHRLRHPRAGRVLAVVLACTRSSRAAASWVIWAIWAPRCTPPSALCNQPATVYAPNPQPCAPNLQPHRLAGAHSPAAPVAARATSRRHFDRIPRPRWEHRPGPHPSRRLIRSPLYIPTAYNRIYSQPAIVFVSRWEHGAASRLRASDSRGRAVA